MKEQYRPLKNVLRNMRSIPGLIREEILVENKSIFGQEWEPKKIDILQALIDGFLDPIMGKLPRRIDWKDPEDWKNSLGYHQWSVVKRVVKRLATEEGGDSQEENDV